MACLPAGVFRGALWNSHAVLGSLLQALPPEVICRASASIVSIVPCLPAPSSSLCLQREAAGFCLLDQKSDRIKILD